MPKFCGKCGSQFDEITGKCTKCDSNIDQKPIDINNTNSDFSKATKRSLNENEKEYTDKKTKQKTNKGDNSKKAKSKVKSFFVKLISLLLVLSVLVGSITCFLAYFDVIDVPVVDSFFSLIGVKKDDSFPDKSYIANEENIVYENECESSGYVNNMLLVIFSKNASIDDINEAVNFVNGEVVGTIKGINQYQIKVEATSKGELEKKCNQLIKYDFVNNAMIDLVFNNTINAIPNDPWKDVIQGSLGVDWDENKPSGTNWWFEATNVLSAYDYESYFENISVGIVDNGFDTGHEDLNITVLNNDVNNSENHGTHVAGIIGAIQNNSIGITGVLKDKSLFGVDCYATNKQKKDNITVSSLIEGIDLCLQNGCKVVNMSSGIKYTKENSTKSDAIASARIATAYLISFLDNYGKNFIVVQSAGNGNDNGKGINAKTYNGYFSSIDEYMVRDIFNEYAEMGQKTDNIVTVEDVMDSIMVVAAIDKEKKKENYQLSSFSNYGDTVTIAAPGVDVFSTIKTGGINGTYGYMDGTSMASPIVSGITALVWSIDETMTAKAVKKIIIDSAVGDVLSRQKNDNDNYKLINAKLAVEKVVNRINTQIETTTSIPIAISSERDVVLVLDTSGSMSGEPLEQTKRAAEKFVDTVLAESANVAIVNYEDSAYMASHFTNNATELKRIINELYDGGGTNIESGLRMAEQLLLGSNAEKKIIVLMSDGEPNDGLVGEELISYSNTLKENGTYIYTLGFFESMGDEKSDAQLLMEGIASEGCHYEVSDAESLVFFFGDIADQINGQKYIYVRIACPVNVSVEYNGETLDSSERNLNTRTDFGTLTFEDSNEETFDNSDYDYSYYSDYDTQDDRVKILRLKEGEDYNIKIVGIGRGRMDYSIGFMDENGEYSDFRKFKNVSITRKTEIDTVATVSDKTVLNVDEDGDGRYDITYEARENENGQIVDHSYIIYILVGLVGFLILLISILVISIKIKKYRRKKFYR